MMILMHKSYEAWKIQFDELQAKKKEQDLPPESDLNPEQISMFKMTRGLVRLFMYYMKPSPPDGDLPSLIAKAMFGISPDEGELANISTKMLTEFASPQETSDMLMHVLRGALGDHIGESEDVRKIVLATVTAWKDSSTQRYLKGIVDTINAIHRDERDRVVGDGRAAAMLQSPSRARGRRAGSTEEPHSADAEVEVEPRDCIVTPRVDVKPRRLVRGWPVPHAPTDCLRTPWEAKSAPTTVAAERRTRKPSTAG